MKIRKPISILLAFLLLVTIGLTACSPTPADGGNNNASVEDNANNAESDAEDSGDNGSDDIEGEDEVENGSEDDSSVGDDSETEDSE
jgi:hypothetical protein